MLLLVDSSVSISYTILSSTGTSFCNKIMPSYLPINIYVSSFHSQTINLSTISTAILTTCSIIILLNKMTCSHRCSSLVKMSMHYYASHLILVLLISLLLNELSTTYPYHPLLKPSFSSS